MAPCQEHVILADGKPKSVKPEVTEELKVCAIVVNEKDILEPVFPEEYLSPAPTVYVRAVHDPAISEAALKREAYKPYLSVFEPA